MRPPANRFASVLQGVWWGCGAAIVILAGYTVWVKASQVEKEFPYGTLVWSGAENAGFVRGGGIIGNYVAIESEQGFTVRRLDNGKEVWSRLEETYPYPQRQLAGTVDKPVVVDFKDELIIARNMTNGVELWRKNLVHDSVAYSDSLFWITCLGEANCTLGRDDIQTGASMWSRKIDLLPNDYKVLHDTSFTGMPPQFLSLPTASPKLIGATSGEVLSVIRTADGRQVNEYPWEQLDRSYLLGDTVVRSKTSWKDGKCGVTLDFQNAVSNKVAGHWTDIDFGTVTGTACQQDEAPLAGSMAASAQIGGVPVVISPADQRKLWIGNPGDRIITLAWPNAAGCTASKKVFIADLEQGTTITFADAPNCDHDNIMYAVGGRVLSIDRRVRAMTMFPDGNPINDVVGAGSFVHEGSDETFFILRDTDYGYHIYSAY